MSQLPYCTCTNSPSPKWVSVKSTGSQCPVSTSSQSHSLNSLTRTSSRLPRVYPDDQSRYRARSYTDSDLPLPPCDTPRTGSGLPAHRSTSQLQHRPRAVMTVRREFSEQGLTSVKDSDIPLPPCDTPRTGSRLPTQRSTSQLQHRPRAVMTVRREFSEQGLASVKDCGCPCRCDYNKQMSHTSVYQVEEETTQEDLSWRRLHMSRAKLKATATTSELLSGFAMIAMVELQINDCTTVPEWLFVTFAVCTTVLVSVHIFALMISTYLLPNIDAVSKLHKRGLISESPHERMRGFIELAWAFSTILGLFLFLVEIAILCWVKFWDTSFMAAWAATIIVIPSLVVFIGFAVFFYHNLVVHKVRTASDDMRQLEALKQQLDTATTTIASCYTVEQEQIRWNKMAPV